MQPNLNFWPIQNETGSVERFLSRLDASVIFADPEFSRLAGSFAPAAAHEWIALAPGQDESVFANASPSWKGRNIFLFCVAGYAARAARLKDAAAKVGARFVDWPYEVFPSFVGFNDSWRQTDDELAPLRRQFLIISTARSGSTYLAELLQKNGFGNPKEHIRKPYFELIRHRKAFGIDLARFGRRLERAYEELMDSLYFQQSIAEISFRWGFNDSAYFSRAFRELFGLSPSQHRDSWRWHETASSRAEASRRPPRAVSLAARSA